MMMRPGGFISQTELADLKARNPVTEIAARYVRLRPHREGMIGPCPMCSLDPQKSDSTRFECDADKWVCAVCTDGGDVISLVERVERLDFLGAVEWLGGARRLDRSMTGQPELERQQRRPARARQTLEFREQERRERERRTLFAVWRRALPVRGTPVEDYLRLRKLELPPTARLRGAADMPFYVSGEPVHRGWAMLAAIVGRDGRFCGLHITWIDLNDPKGQARVVDPKTKAPLPAKKVRGSKLGGVIEVAPVAMPERLIMGEGIETVASVWVEFKRAGRDLSTTAFWSSVDLGNMAGRAVDTVPHPTLRMADSRPQRVAGPEPDLNQPGIAIPDSVRDLVLLGDGDSDRFLTQCFIARAAKRFAREGRAVRVAWAPPGCDFNDVLRGAA
jgi:CHC2 zinc finger